MKDLQKIKEFFSKPLGEIKTDKYGNHIEPQFKKGDKVTYLGHPAEITAINKEMGGTYSYSVSYDKGTGKTKASNLSNKGGEIKLAEAEEKYTVAGHSVTLNKGKKSDGTDWTVTFKNGKSKPLADVLALIKPMPKGITMSEAKSETGVDMIKKKLDALGVKYEMSKTDKVRPFKVIYRPVNKEDDWYDKFEDIVDLFNLKGVVKSSMSEAKSISDYKVGDVLNLKDGETWKVVKLTSNGGVLAAPFGKTKDSYISIAIEFPAHVLEKEVVSLNEATKDEETKFHTKLDKLVHDTFGKRKGEMEEAELSEAYVPSNIKEFAKRKGVSSLVNKVAGWAERVGARITGGTAIGKNYDTLILDMGYQTADIYINIEDGTIELYGEPADSFPQFKEAFMNKVTRDEIEKDEDQFRREQGLEETLLERVFNRIKNDQSRTKR